MLDIKLIRESLEMVKANLEKRGNPENLRMLQELVEADKQWREDLTKLNDLRHERKVCTQEIATLKKAKQEVQAKLQVDKAKTIEAEITAKEKEVAVLEEKTHDMLMNLPNLLHETVPFGTSDQDNVEVKKWGDIPQFTFTPKSHIDLALDLDIVDVERAGKVAGARFFYLKGLGVLLDYALMNFAMETLAGRDTR